MKNKPRQKILHPTDFSETANNALSFAQEIALKKYAGLLVMHSFKPPYNYGTKELMDDLITKSRAKNVNLETSFEEGNTVPNILGIDADLIVMGSKRKTNMETILFGNVACKVILESSVPVLVIPSEHTYSDFKNIAFATDYRDRDLEALQYTIELATLFNAKITILHIASKNDLESKIKFKGFKEHVTENFGYPEIEFRLIFDKDFNSGFFSFLNEYEKETDLLVMTRYKKTFLQSLMQKNNLKKAKYTEVPLMVLPGDENLLKTS